MLVLTSLIVLAISSLCKNILMSYILNMGALALPGFLVVSGVEVMKYLSSIIAVSSAEILWNAGGTRPAGLIYYAIVIAAAFATGGVGLNRNRSN